MTRKAKSDRRPFTTTFPASFLRQLDADARALRMSQGQLLVNAFRYWNRARTGQAVDGELLH